MKRMTFDLLPDEASFTIKQDFFIKEAADSWRQDKAIKRAAEELLELGLVLLHWDRNKATTDEVLREMADVRIALRHLEFRFGSYQEQLNEKVKKAQT